MKAHEPVDFSKIIDEEVKDKTKQAVEFALKAEKARQLAPLFRRLSYFYATRAHFWGNARLYLRVDKLSDAEPALRMIEDEFGVKFDKSEDLAGSSWAQREFKAEGLPFSLIAEPTFKDPTCRTVQDGFETVPKYKVVCDDETKAA